MASPKVLQATSLQDYVRIIEQAREGAMDRILWYRGCGRSDYTLLSSLYRNSEKPDAADLIALESRMLDRFEQRSIPYLHRELTSNWERLFVMQHHGVPTRLLDWSENPFIALYLAMTSAMRRNTPGQIRSSAAVWILDPVAWNQKALDQTSFKGGVLSTSHSHASSYAPSSDAKNMNNDPVCVYAAHSSVRIVAQRGVFTISGQSLSPMEDLFDANGYPTNVLLKVEIDGNIVPALFDSVVAIGYSSSVVFPDLDGLARELTLQFGLRR